MEQLQQWILAVSLFVLLLAAQNSAEFGRQGPRPTNNPGMLLPDMNAPRTDASAVPEFLMNIYNCWSSSSANSDLASCLPVSDRTAKNLDDVNVVRGIKGTGTDDDTGLYFEVV